MDYITQPKDYWIAPSAINITRNAFGSPNRIQGSVSGGAVISCYIAGVNGLGLDNGRNPKRWALSLSPTYFTTFTEKYVYAAIPRTEAVGTQAVVVFPSEKLDIYGVNANDEQIGSVNYYYIWLQGILSSSGTYGNQNREWTAQIDFGKLGTYEDITDMSESDWYTYSKVNNIVTFLKPIFMKAGSFFQNLILGNKELAGVATSETDYTDSDTLVATPGYVESQYLSKTHESTAQEQVGFLKGLWIGVRSLYEITANGIAKLKSVIAESVTATRIQTDSIASANYTGDGVADTGFRLTNAYNGHSKLTIDELYVRMKAVFESLEVRERTYTGGDQIWSCAGNRITRVDYLGNIETADHVPQMMRVRSNGQPASEEEQDDVYSVPVPGDTYGYSDVKVPWLLRQMPLLARAKVFARYRKVRIVINEPSASGARRAAAESLLANIRRARCYFLAKDDDMEVNNWWRINDLARCQTMNLANTTRKTYLSGEDEKAGNIFWWRKVIGVSYEPVTLDDGKQYHYFDVAFDYEYEQSHPEVMATSVMEGSDIPAAQDAVVQFGNTIIEGRMNLMMMEVNGSDSVGYNPTTDAPCLKAYRGIYCFDLNKSWVGGNPCKMKLSPKSGYEFYGPNFKQVTEYDVVPVPVDRGLWTGITPTRDDGGEHTMVRKCYYYDKVSHNGSYWLCSIADGAHWVNSDGNYISDVIYNALTEEQKALCSRKQNYTIEEPSANSTDWTEVVQKGSSGNTPAMLFMAAPSGTTLAAPICTADNYMNNVLPQGWSKSAPNRADGYNVWMSQNAVITGSDGTYTLENVNWSVPTRISGDKGDDGKDGWMITADPANVIIAQALGNNLTSFSSVKVSFTAKKGNASAVITGIAIPTGQQALSNEFNAAIGTGDDAKKVIVSSPKTHGTPAEYYTEGTFVVDVIATDPDTGSSVTFNVTVPCYANLLGTWKEAVVADVKHDVATSKFYFEDENGNVVAHETIGDFIKSSTESTSVLTKKISDGKNLLSGVLTGSGWQLNGNNIATDADDKFIIPSGYLVSTPYTIGEDDGYYTLSYEADGNATIGFYVNGSAVVNVPYISGVRNGRRYITFNSKWTDDAYLDGTLVFRFSDVGYVRHPQLETGNIVTEFSTGTSETSSRIHQTANEIETKVNDTGVNITDGEIKLYADKVKFFKNKAQATSGDTAKIWIDGSDGSLHAIDGKFSGNIYTPYKRLTSSNIGEYETEDFYGDTVVNLAKTGLNIQVEVERETPTQEVHIRLPKITADMLGCEVNILNASGDAIEINGSGRYGQVDSGGYLSALVKSSVGLKTVTILNLNAGYEAKFRAIHNPYMPQHESLQYSWLCCYANINP